MPSSATKATPKNDFMGTALTVALVLVMAVYTTSYEQVPTLRNTLAMLMAGLALLLAYFAALLDFRRALPLLVTLFTVIALTVSLQWAGLPQEFNVLLRYLTAIAGLFATHMIRSSNLTRYMAFASMGVIAYAAYIAATGGEFAYAGTVRTTPFWSGPTNSSCLVAALIVVVSLSPVKRYLRLLSVGVGITVLGGYGVVTPMLMVALFFAGWYFLHRGWNRMWLFILGAVAVLAGVLFRNANSVQGADIQSLGLGAVGSGRLDSWLGRFADFADRDVASMMLGFGPFSDYQVSELWFWEEKNAHSDLVTVLMEFGLVGFTAFLVLGVVTYRRSSDLGQIAMLAIALGAMASNTFIDRPSVAVGWGFVLYACGYVEVTSKAPQLKGHMTRKYPLIATKPQPAAVDEHCAGRHSLQLHD